VVTLLYVLDIFYIYRILDDLLDVWGEGPNCYKCFFVFA